MYGNEITSLAHIYFTDIGIFVCCIISIACRIKIFTATSLGKYANYVSFFFADMSDATQTMGVKKDAAVESYKSINLCVATGRDASDDKKDFDNGDVKFVAAESYKEKFRRKRSLFTRLVSLPLTLRITVFVGFLSVISNCLTFYLRFSQAVYSFLLFFIDIVLYGAVGIYPEKQRHNLSLLSPSSCFLKFFFCICAAVSTPSAYIGIISVLFMRLKNKSLSYLGAKRKETANVCSGEYQEEDMQLSAKCTSTVDFYDFEITLRADACGGEKNINGYGVGDKRGRLFFTQQPKFCVVDFCTLFLFFIFVYFLVVFHTHHLFYWLGTLAGYLACCGTLFVFGCNLGVFWVLFYCLGATKNSLPSASFSFSSSKLVDTASRSGYFGVSSLPSLGVMADRSLWVWHVMQLIFSFGCLVFYFSMLLEERKRFYIWHTEFMLWYVAIVAQGLSDILRLFVFWQLTQLCSSQEGKNWLCLIYQLD